MRALGGVTSSVGRAPPMPSSWAAARSARGARGSSREAGLADVVLVEQRHPRRGRQLARGRHGPGPGRHRGGRAARPVQPRLLRRPAGAARHRLRLRRPGLLHAVLLRARGRRGARPDRHAAGARPRRALGGPRRARRPQPGDGPRRDAGWLLRPRRRLHRPAPQRARLHRGPVHLGRPGARAHRVHRSAPRRRPGRPASRRPGARSRRDASCSPAARPWPRSAGRPAYGSRPEAPATRSWSPSPIRTWRPTGCRWSSTSRPGSTGGPRRAACSGG